jgi:hypothetical protein
MSPLTSTVMILPRLKDALVTKRADRALVIAVWNYADPGTGGVPKTVELQSSWGRMAEILSSMTSTDQRLLIGSEWAGPRFQVANSSKHSDWPGGCRRRNSRRSTTARFV